VSLARVGEWTRAHGAVVLVALALLARAPFVTMVLCGEEGNNGRAALKTVSGQRPALVVARDLGGREYTTPPLHNLGGYLLPALVAGPAIRLIGFSTAAERARAAVALRLGYLLLYALALLAALAMLPQQRRLLGGLLLLVFSLFVLPLLGSLQVQYDGAVSTLLTTVAALALVRGIGETPRWWLLVAGGLAVSVGKLEYVGVAAGTAFVVAVWDRRWRGAAAFLVGALVGSAVWCAIDRQNFLGGYDVMQRFSGISAHVPLVTRVRGYLPEFAALLWPLYAALPLALGGFVIDRQRRQMLVPLLMSAVIFVAFVVVAWHGDGFPRYFAPAFVLLPVALAQLSIAPRVVAALVLLVLAPLALRDWWREATHQPQYALCRRFWGPFDAPGWAQSHESGPLPPCVNAVGMESGLAFYSRRVPFACCGAQWTSEWPQLKAQLCR
jgi:hypothetical protein